MGGTIDLLILSRSSGRTVDTIEQTVHEYRHVPVVWDVRTTAGTLAPPGRYAVSVHLRREAQTVPLSITLDLVAPG